MSQSLKLTVGTAIVLANSGDHSPAANNNLGTRTDQINLTSVANAAARQSTKFDFGANRAPLWDISAALEFAATPTAGNVVNFYLAPSNSATAAVANGGGVSGSDSAYAGYSSNLAASLKQLDFIGAFVCTAQATGTIQVQMSFSTFPVAHRYATLVIENKSGAAFHSDMVESSILLAPVEHQAQDL